MSFTNITWFVGLAIGQDDIITRYVRDRRTGNLVPSKEKEKNWKTYSSFSLER